VFVEVIKSKAKSGKVYETVLVRESLRTPEGPRSRTVCNITGLPPAAQQAVADSLKGLALVSPLSASLHHALDYGGIAVLRDAWARFGLADFLTAMPQPAAARLQAIVFSRLLFPCAKLALADNARGTVLAAACALPAAEAFDEDDLYAAMDQLTGRWSPLVQGLYQKAFPDKVRIALYDITSVYFEGHGPKGLARYGHSRDHRPDRVQVNLAVVTDEKGVPISLSILRGNRADNKTLPGLLKLLKRRFGITAATFVFDGGMSGRINLKAMSGAGLNYVTRLSNATLESLIADHDSVAGEIAQMELGDAPQLIEIEHAGQRHVLAGGAWRAQRDVERRAARLAKGEAILTKPAAAKRRKVNAQKLASTAGRALERAKAHKYFNYEVDSAGQLQWSRRQSVIAEETNRDGWYLLHTNQSAAQSPAADVLSHYKSLLEVEDAFRELKTYLKVRPVYHYRADRVVNHIRLCFLAYWMSARLGREWGLEGNHEEVVRVLRRLQTIRVGELRFEGTASRSVMTGIPPELEETLRALKIQKLFAAPPAWVKAAA
jgi:transposase